MKAGSHHPVAYEEIDSEKRVPMALA